MDSMRGVVGHSIRDPYYVGGGGSSTNFPSSILSGGRVVIADIFRSGPHSGFFR